VLVLSLFYFFVDGRRFVAWVLWLLPLKPSYAKELLEEFWSVAYAMIWGTAAIAVGQGICGSFIFWACGVPAPLLLALAMAFASFIPAVGTALVWVPVAVALAVTGQAYKAAILAAFCILVIVVFVDHLLRPLVVKDKMTMHPLVAFVAMFGGVIVFGLIGLLLGPLIASGLVTIMRIYARDLGPHAEADDKMMAADPPEQKPTGALPELERLRH
jgi:predicted PurR-regulated permease PerM